MTYQTRKAESGRTAAVAPAGSELPSATTEVERRRRWRARQRDGSRLVTIQITRAGIEALIVAGWLDPQQADDRDAITEALVNLAGTALYRRVPRPDWAPSADSIALLSSTP